MGSFSTTHWLIVAGVLYFLWRFFKLSNPKKSQNSAPSPKRADTWEGAFWEVAEPKPSDVTVNLLYCDASGQRTKRTVKVRGFDSDANGLILGYCLLRNESRTFRYDRIERAIDPATGEVIDNLHDWLSAQHRNTPKGQAETLATENIDLFKVLLYMAKADGAMRAAEIQVIANAVAGITNNPSIDVTVCKAALNQLDTPTLPGFK